MPFYNQRKGNKCIRFGRFGGFVADDPSWSYRERNGYLKSGIIMRPAGSLFLMIKPVRVSACDCASLSVVTAIKSFSFFRRAIKLAKFKISTTKFWLIIDNLNRSVSWTTN